MTRRALRQAVRDALGRLDELDLALRVERRPDGTARALVVVAEGAGPDAPAALRALARGLAARLRGQLRHGGEVLAGLERAAG